jgi:adenylate kinase
MLYAVCCVLCAAQGKTTTAQQVAEAGGLRYINVGDWVKEQQLHCGFDEEHEAYIIDEDKVGPRLDLWVAQGVLGCMD